MNRFLPVLSACATFAACPAVAQGMPFLFTLSQPEQTLSGSGGTVLRTLRPNEISLVEFVPCPVISAEKWAPRTCFHTMAGDDNSDSMYWNPMFASAIDALVEIPSPVVGGSTQRTVFWSPSVPVGTGVSGPPGLRPGDVGRIVRNGTQDGQVEHFITAEQVQQALGMPIAPVVVDVDAMAADPGYGIFFSLDQNHAVNLACNVTFVQDGDLLLIPSSAITWTWDLRVQSVVPGSAVRVFSEAQMDLLVQNAQVTDRNGQCVTQIQDLEALDIDYAGPIQAIALCPGNIVTIPALIFAGELMTGASLLTTDGGGQIYSRGCGPIGRTCGGGGPTLGIQLGLQPTSGNQGVASHVNALTSSVFPQRFVIEPHRHVIPAWTPVVMDVFAPSPLTWVFVAFAPSGVNAVAPSTAFPNMMFPDLYIPMAAWWTTVPQGFSTFVSPNIPGSCKLVWQGVSIWNNQVVLGTPAMVDVL